MFVLFPRWVTVQGRFPMRGEAGAHCARAQEDGLNSSTWQACCAVLFWSHWEESRVPKWVSVVRGQIGKKRLITGSGMNNTVSKCKDVPLPLQKFCSKSTWKAFVAPGSSCFVVIETWGHSSTARNEAGELGDGTEPSPSVVKGPERTTLDCSEVGWGWVSLLQSLLGTLPLPPLRP